MLGQDMDESIDRTTRLMIAIVPYPFILLATVGNILSFKLLSMVKNVSSTTVYLRFLALADMLTIDVTFFVVVAESLVQQPITRNTDVACKLFTYVSYTISDIAVWIVPLLSLDRVLALFLPTRSRQYSNPRSARIALISLFVIIAVKNLTHLIFNATTTIAFGNSTISGYCGVYPGLEQLAFIRSVIEMTLVVFLPVTLVIVMNIMIVVGIRGRLARMSPGGDLAAVKALKSSITMTLAVSVAYVIFLVPFSVYTAIPADQLAQLLSPKMSYFVWLILIYIFSLNHACNFILYVIVSPTFRRDLRAMFCRPRNRVTDGPVTFDTSLPTVG